MADAMPFNMGNYSFGQDTKYGTPVPEWKQNLSDIKSWFDENGYQTNRNLTPEEVQQQRDEVAAATKTNPGPALGALGLLALVSLMGGKQGAQSAGRNAGAFMDSYHTADKERINQNLAAVNAKWKAQADERRANGEMMKEIYGKAITPMFEARMKQAYPSGDNLTPEAKNFNYGNRVPGFFDFLDRNKKDSPERMPSSDQIVAQILQKQAQGGKLTPDEQDVLKQYANMKAYPGMMLPYAMGLVPSLPQVAPGAGRGAGSVPTFK